jgi:hypothetical protein
MKDVTIQNFVKIIFPVLFWLLSFLLNVDIVTFIW